MAASTENSSESKDKPKPYHYAPIIQPDDDVLDLYIETLSSCEYYNSDYKACKATKGRVNQYFVYGKELDCEHLNNINKTCEKYLETKEKQYKDYMLSYEKAKRDFRVRNATANDVWEYRTTPYADWNSDVQTVAANEINEDDNFIPARQYANQIVESSLNESVENSDEKSGTVVNQSSDKGGNSNNNSEQKGITSSKSGKSADFSENNNNKSWCSIS